MQNHYISNLMGDPIALAVITGASLVACFVIYKTCVFIRNNPALVSSISVLTAFGGLFLMAQGSDTGLPVTLASSVLILDAAINYRKGVRS